MTRRALRFDPLAMLERGYDLAASPEDWLRGVVDAARPGFPDGSFVGGSLVGFDDAGGRSVVHEVRDPDEPSGYEGVTRRVFGALPGSLLSAFFGPAPFVGEARYALGAESTLHGASSVAHESVGFTVGDGRGVGLALGTFVPRGTHLSARDRQRWFRIGAHLGAAIRLRARLAGGACDPDAAFSSDGRVAHLSEAAARTPARAALVDAVGRLARAKAMRRTSPDESLALFRALVAGRYSVVDWVDTDGKRFVVVHENPIPGRSPRALAPREAQVAERMLEGRSNSEIAYLLGVAPSTVNRIARDVLTKLGGARRSDLPRLFERGVAVGCLDDFASAPTLALGPVPGDPSLWGRLSGAESAVVRLALRGRSNESIADARGVSTRTVANQLARVYARFGVRGRIELGGLLGDEPLDVTGASGLAE